MLENEEVHANCLNCGNDFVVCSDEQNAFCCSDKCNNEYLKYLEAECSGQALEISVSTPQSKKEAADLLQAIRKRVAEVSG